MSGPRILCSFNRSTVSASRRGRGKPGWQPGEAEQRFDYSLFAAIFSAGHYFLSRKEGQVTEFHEVANIFPMMTSEEYRDLVDDIRKNGQKVPIETYQGLIIDGRNRYKACSECGIEPQYKEWDGNGSLVEHVVSLNMKRRDLTRGQRAAIGLEVEEMLAVEAKKRQLSTLKQNQSDVEKFPPREQGKSRDQAAKIVGTNPHYITDAKAIKKQSPDLAFPLLKEGKIMMNEAKVVAKLPQEKQEEIAQLPPRKQKAVIGTLRRNDSKEKETQKQSASQVKPDPPRITSEVKPSAHTSPVTLIYVDPPIDIDPAQLAKCEAKFKGAQNAMLFLWADTWNLAERMDLMAEWGFAYRSNMVWSIPMPLEGDRLVSIAHRTLLIGEKGSCGNPTGEIPESLIFSHTSDVFLKSAEEMYPGSPIIIIKEEMK